MCGRIVACLQTDDIEHRKLVNRHVKIHANHGRNKTVFVAAPAAAPAPAAAAAAPDASMVAVVAAVPAAAAVAAAAAAAAVAVGCSASVEARVVRQTCGGRHSRCGGNSLP